MRARVRAEDIGMARGRALSALVVSRDGGLVRLRLNRPQVLNALDADMAEAFLAACRELAQDASVRAVLLSGEGRAFCAGGDLAELREAPVATAERLITALHEALRLLARIDAPVVASVHGAVAGGGFSLAMSADLVIAADDARFNLAYIKLGASCDLGSTWSLPRMVGLRRALEIALLGESFDAAQALQMGLINRVVPRGALEAEAEALVQGLARGPTRAAGRIRRLMRTSVERSFGSQLDAESDAFLQSAATADFEEGLNAFLDKRSARFRGR